MKSTPFKLAFFFSFFYLTITLARENPKISAPFVYLNGGEFWVESKDLPELVKKRIAPLKKKYGHHDISDTTAMITDALKIPTNGIFFSSGKKMEVEIKQTTFSNMKNHLDWGDCNNYPKVITALKASLPGGRLLRNSGWLLKQGAELIENPKEALAAEYLQFQKHVRAHMKKPEAGEIANSVAEKTDAGFSQYLEGTFGMKDANGNIFLFSSTPSIDFEVAQIHLFNPKTKKFSFYSIVSRIPCGS